MSAKAQSAEAQTVSNSRYKVQSRLREHSVKSIVYGSTSLVAPLAFVIRTATSTAAATAAIATTAAAAAAAAGAAAAVAVISSPCALQRTASV
eukprot:11716-Heterococcus_DN1.PRE.3